ncbi:MAG: hypothetical protein JNM70_03805 [Anaerolineae bacterium]|nr:hypothetical protein [Anaerolineae bacterium]
MKPIPDRQAVEDVFSGVLFRLQGHTALAVEAPSDCEVVASGSFVIRYGLRFLGKLHVAIVPELVALDYGDFLVGEDAWEFLLQRSNRYPRSEVIGHRNDGSDDMVFIRTLDMAVPPMVLVYENREATNPLASPTALIASQTDGLPERLCQFLPVYPQIDVWQETLTE